MSGLRKINIDLGQQYDLNKRRVITSIKVEIESNPQQIVVNFRDEWITPDTNEIFKIQTNSFTLQNQPDKITPEVLDENGEVVTSETVEVGRKYLDEWDGAVGDIIEAGIVSYGSEFIY